MSFKLLKCLFKVGKFLAITPPSLTIAKASLKEKIYGSCMIGLYTVALVVSLIYRAPQYSRYIHIKLTIHVVLDIMLYIFCIQAITVALLKRHLWYKLIRNLKTTRDNKFLEKNYLPGFLLINAFFWTINIYLMYVFGKLIGVEFFKQYSVDFLQVYVQFITNYLTCAVLKMLELRYKSLRYTLGCLVRLAKKLDANSANTSLRRVKHSFLLLRQTVDIFSEVFGWSILLNILHGSLQMVIYLDDALAGNAAMSVDWMISDVSIILLYCAGTVVTILLCDSVLYETEHILTVTYKLEKYLPAENKQELNAFINSLADNFPQFSAARFFVIDKSTILKIFNAVLTFFIVIIQFENSLGNNTLRSFGPTNKTD